MKRAAIFSALLHGLLLLLAILGLPFSSFRKDLVLPTPVPVEILPVAKETQAPDPSPVPAKEEKKDTPLKPLAKPVPAPAPSQEHPPEEKKLQEEPAPTPPSQEEMPEAISETEEVTQPIKKKQEVKPKPEPLVKPPKPLVKPKPAAKKEKEKKQKPVPAFDSVLKNIAKLKTSSDTDDKADKNAEGSSSSHAGKVGPALTMSEIDALRQQIAGCWSINPGAKDIDRLIITLEIWVNQDRTVRDVKIIHNPEHAANAFYRSIAESAVRAVRDPRCSPLKLPVNKYEQWKDIILNFRPPV